MDNKKFSVNIGETYFKEMYHVRTKGGAAT